MSNRSEIYNDRNYLLLLNSYLNLTNRSNEHFDTIGNILLNEENMLRRIITRFEENMDSHNEPYVRPISSVNTRNTQNNNTRNNELSSLLDNIRTNTSYRTIPTNRRNRNINTFIPQVVSSSRINPTTPINENTNNTEDIENTENTENTETLDNSPTLLNNNIRTSSIFSDTWLPIFYNNSPRGGVGRNDTFFDPIPVRPTIRQYLNAVENVCYGEIEEPQNTTCPITLTNFNNYDSVTRIKFCGHIFLSNSLTRWFDNNVRCPMCRYDIRNYVGGTSINENNIEPEPEHYLQENNNNELNIEDNSSNNINANTSNTNTNTSNTIFSSMDDISLNTISRYITYELQNLILDSSNNISDISMVNINF